MTAQFFLQINLWISFFDTFHHWALSIKNSKINTLNLGIFHEVYKNPFYRSCSSVHRVCVIRSFRTLCLASDPKPDARALSGFTSLTFTSFFNFFPSQSQIYESCVKVRWSIIVETTTSEDNMSFCVWADDDSAFFLWYRYFILCKLNNNNNKMRRTVLLTLFLVTSTLCLNLGEFTSDKLPHPSPPHNLDQGQGSFPVGCCCCCCCCCCPVLPLLLTFVFTRVFKQLTS